MQNDSNEKPEEILSKLNSEASKTFWIELLPFFAKGMVVHVSHNLDLIEVAYQLSKDNRKQIEEWMGSKLISKVTFLETIHCLHQVLLFLSHLS